jgi:hypothetical protein
MYVLTLLLLLLYCYDYIGASFSINVTNLRIKCYFSESKMCEIHGI